MRLTLVASGSGIFMLNELTDQPTGLFKPVALNGSITIQLAAGETVFLRTTVGGAGTATLRMNPFVTYFSGHRVY